MIIKRLELKNFRNHASSVLEFSPEVNMLVGNNAQGKTNVLEAIYLSCVGRGWRTNKDRELIKFDAQVASVKADVKKEYGGVEVEILLSTAGKKQITINKIPVKKMGELMGQINCVFFSPDELRLVKEAPADRRRFMDIDISQIDKSYFYSLLRYNKILSQRNALLKSRDEDIVVGLNIWDEQLAKEGEKIISRRKEFIEELKMEVGKVHEGLTDSKERIEIEYESNGDINDGGLLEALRGAREKDMRLKTTTVGPHRDDISILINGKDVRRFGSQGQQRTVALSLKLAELEIFRTKTGEYPVLLLDDVFSELDQLRKSNLLEMVRKVQTIITCTETSATNIKMFYIKNGKTC